MKKTLAVLLVLFYVMFSFPIYANADMGPKPSVYITFENKNGEPCYATLFSESKSLGPTSAWDGTDSTAIYQENGFDSGMTYDIWKAFIDYQNVDPDGFYFQQVGWRIDKTQKLSWTYYPPNKFKIVLYYPETNTYRVSEICERYAFSSYFVVNLEPEHSYPLSAVRPDSENYWLLKIDQNYDYSAEIISFFARVVLTLVCEILLALVFGYSEKKQLTLITLTNVVTQMVLNIALSVITYRSGFIVFLLNLILFELVVFVIEALIYYFQLPKFSEKMLNKKMLVLYALLANLSSAFIGYFLVKILF